MPHPSPVWMLGTELGSSGSAQPLLITKPSLQPQLPGSVVKLVQVFVVCWRCTGLIGTCQSTCCPSVLVLDCTSGHNIWAFSLHSAVLESSWVVTFFSHRTPGTLWQQPLGHSVLLQELFSVSSPTPRIWNCIHISHSGSDRFQEKSSIYGSYIREKKKHLK